MSSDSAAVLGYNLLGGFRLRRDGTPVPPDAWERPMAARVVRLLLVERGFVTEDRLLEAFWRDRDPAAARRCLAVSVCRCRGVLGATAIEASERAYRLVLGPLDSVDSDLFERAAALALDRADGPARTAALEHAAGLWHGEPLPEDRYSDWAQEWRDALVDMRGPASTRPPCAPRGGCWPRTRWTRAHTAASWPGTRRSAGAHARSSSSCAAAVS